MTRVLTDEEFNTGLQTQLDLDMDSLTLASFAESLPESVTPEQMDRIVPAMLRYNLQAMPRGYVDGIDAFDPVPSQENNWLYDAKSQTFAGKFIDRRMATDRVFAFTIARQGDEWLRSFKPISGVEDGGS